jgi:preprotein translocase subunit Sss1
VHVTAQDMQAAQGITLAALALFLLVGRVPRLRPYAQRVRGTVLAVYLMGAVGFMVYLALR